MTKDKLVPPDGGWGWVIVCATALNNLIFIPIMQCFGLIFKDTFTLMGFSATDGSVIINTNAAFGMMMGLINGPLLRIYGYRKVSVAGATFISVGILLTAFANTFTFFIITYGFLTAFGMGMVLSSYTLALNTYFFKNRSKATGIAMTITGLGPILMPQLVSILLSSYGVKYAVIILAAITANSFVSACLLQPVKWHMKKVTEEESELDDKKDETVIHVDETKRENGDLVMQTNLGKGGYVDSIETINHDAEIQAIYGFETPLAGSLLSLNTGLKSRRMSTASSYRSAVDRIHSKNKWSSLNSIHTPITSLIDIPEMVDKQTDIKNEKDINYNGSLLPTKTEAVYNPNMSTKKEKKSRIKRYLFAVIHFFDLTLLKDPKYVNIMIGMSLAIFAELNFSLLTPFMLADLKLTTSEIATFLSVLSIADLCFRFFAPFIGDYLKKPPRMMYSISLLLLIGTRYCLLLFTDYTSLLGVALALGIAKGVRTVYMSLVIPSYVPIERLASASGLQMMMNGVFILIGGPALGFIRDITGSYTNCIYIINLVTLTTILMWSFEALYFKYKKSRLKENQIAS